jgi:MTH538 TIR-like domain (DUF1863)
MQNQEFHKFSAFISYSSKDHAFARKLHRDIENYRVPIKYEKYSLLDNNNRLRPIFLDSEELKSGKLSSRLESALEASATLIVVCSPHAATSEWVAKEIEHFRKLGRSEKIFAIIKEGVPNAPEASAREECLPLALRGPVSPGDARMGVIAGDARRSYGYRSAWLKVVAGILGINLGALIVRDHSRYLAASFLFGVILTILISAIVVTVSIMKGYESQMASSIVAIQGHAIALGFESLDPAETERIVETILRNENVRHISPLVEQVSLISSGGRHNSVLARGLTVASRTPELDCQICSIAQRLASVPEGAAVGRSLARQFGLSPGDEIYLTHNLNNQPATQKFVVADIPEYDYLEFETGVILLNLKAAQTFLRRDGKIDGAAIWLSNGHGLGPARAAIEAETNGRIRLVGFEQRNGSFFAALKAEQQVAQAVAVIPLVVTVYPPAGSGRRGNRNDIWDCVWRSHRPLVFRNSGLAGGRPRNLVVRSDLLFGSTFQSRAQPRAAVMDNCGQHYCHGHGRGPKLRIKLW